MRKHLLHLLLAGLLTTFCTRLPAQSPKITITGTILNTAHQPLPKASVSIPAIHLSTLTDSLGHFTLVLPQSGRYTIRITCISYKEIKEELEVSASLEKTWLLASSAQELNTVQVTGLSGAAEARRQPVKAQIVNTQAVKEQPSSLIELMNRSAGIRIRQTGGLGSTSNLMLNGFQNRAVRFFKDGIPLDYLGGGFDLSLVPVNMLERVEVHKGVLPVYLGADALGGAVNLITRNIRETGAEISYETGSFNTHRASLNAVLKSRNGKYLAGINGFFNYSDNNYWVDVESTDNTTGTKKNEHVKLFHNKDRNYYTEAFLATVNRPWADELRLSLTGFAIDREFQFGATMDKPFGAAKGSQHSLIPTLLYKKTFLQGKLTLNQFFVYNTFRVKTTDTAHGHYDWQGNFTPNASEVGELAARGSLSDIRYSYFTSRTNLSYKLNAVHTLTGNAVLNNYRRKGSDPYGYKFADGTDVLQSPARYNKMVLAAGLSSNFFGGRLQNNLIGKFFRFHTDASDADYQGNRKDTRNSHSEWGIADGIRFLLNEKSALTLSAETALRLPEMDELFGDGNLKLSNFQLRPERSTNLNLGYNRTSPGKYSLEANVFYRHTKDLILLMPYNFMFAQSQNVSEVRGEGVDVDGNYSFFPWLNAGMNITYQNLRLVNTGYAATEGARLKNTPYFFANGSLTSKIDHPFSKKDKLNLYWYYSFVREFYLDYIPRNVEPSGFLGLFGKTGIDARNIIPNQSVHSIGFTYYPAKLPMTLGAQLKNIFDAKVYDNFKVQNPGRSFFIKIGYQIK